MHIAQIQFIHCEIERHGPSECDTVYSHSLQLSVPFIFQFHYTGFSAARRKEKASSEASAEAGGPPPPSPLWNKGLSPGVAASLHHDVASDAGWQSERLGPPRKHPPSKASIIFYCGYNRGCPLRAASISIDSTAGCLLLPRQKFSDIRVIFVDLCSTAFWAKSYLWMEKKNRGVQTGNVQHPAVCTYRNMWAGSWSARTAYSRLVYLFNCFYCACSDSPEGKIKKRKLHSIV